MNDLINPYDKKDYIPFVLGSTILFVSTFALEDFVDDIVDNTNGKVNSYVKRIPILIKGEWALFTLVYMNNDNTYFRANKRYISTDTEHIAPIANYITHELFRRHNYSKNEENKNNR